MEKVVTLNHDLPLLHFPNSRKPFSIPSPILRISSFKRHKKRSCLASSSRLGFYTETKTVSESHGVIVDNSTIGRRLLGLAAAVSVAVSLSIFCDSPALAESLTIAFPVSRAREVIETMVEMFPLRSADAAYGKLKAMLSTLGDPFTRLITPKEYQSFRIGSDGNLQGVGLFINSEPRTGHLVSDQTHLETQISLVFGLFVHFLSMNPADRAGIHEGEELVEINGEKLDDVDSEAAAQKLRGRVGTFVTIKLKNVLFGTDSGIREVTVTAVSVRCVKLPRDYIKLSPISSAIIPHTTPDGRLAKTGYVKLTAFSQTAASDMENAVHEMENQDVQSYILDLRNNPLLAIPYQGGLVRAGLDVAQLWLDGDETLVYTIDREGVTSPINMINGHAVTHDPLVVLVNEGSASASEILAGALHDNGRAILVGNRTFGKGKIQSITELNDGSALFVTVAKYLSPSLHEIDQVGIAPDVQCTTGMIDSLTAEIVEKMNSSVPLLEADSCVMVAEHELEARRSNGTAS
ncbi:carboxyl terminal protease-like protein [Arabidopsis thaliana]|nr:carboxyl terminal protease-like protein [Arabidopsis thaliana]